MTEVYLLRHGQVEGPRSLRGKTDSPLTQDGLSAMHRTIANLQFDVLVSSPLQRCIYFSNQLSQLHSVPVHIEPALAEMDFGDWDGMDLDELWRSDSSSLQNFWSNPLTHTPPNGEPVRLFIDRVIDAFDATLQKYASKKILIVTHAGVIKSILARSMHVELSSFNCFTHLAIDYASISSLKFWENDETMRQAVINYVNRSAV